MNNDLDDWIKFMKKTHKRKHNENELINELKLMAINNIEEAILKSNLKGRHLTIFLSSIEETFSHSKLVLNDQDEEFSLTLNAFVYILVELIQELKNEIYSRGKKFNILSFFSKKKKQLFSNSNKRTKIMPINLELVDEVQEDSEYESTDEEMDEEMDEETDEDLEEDLYNNEIEDMLATTDLIDPNRKKSKVNVNKDFLEELKASNIKNNSVENIMEYFNNLESNVKKSMITKLKDINNCINSNKPLLFHILNLPLTIETKKELLTKASALNSNFGDNTKLKNWFDNFMKLPLGITKGVDINSIKTNKVNKFLNKLKNDMDSAVFGHDNAKKQIVQIMAQKVRNPNCKGSVIGIYGVPGNGKTSLVKEGIAKAMNKPFIFISLGGAQDSSFLDGHSYTYEGSIFGRIAQGLIESKCMDPIFYFDELDKVSGTRKGEEIINMLIHLIDPVQNSHFRDKYFHGINLDLSKATFIFSFNEINRVNYILLDRITTIETKHLLLPQKLHIVKNYMLPSILEDLGITDKIIISEDIILNIINNYTNEGGVRRLKKHLYELCRELNVLNLTKNNICNEQIEFPYKLSNQVFSTIFEDKYKFIPELIHKQDHIGMVNGLWANSLGNGGVLPIESTMIPSKTCMEIKATGSLEKVIKESIEVALSVAWNFIPKEIQNEWMERWKKYPESFHIHCPDGAVSKDGPSAGAAMGLTFYSRLMNKKVNHTIAMTGEMNLRGEVTKIGGLEEKLTGAKRAGATLVLIPKENAEDLIIINKRNSNLLCENFKVISIDKFSQVLEYSLV
jgi:hypothetical protein